MAVLWAQATSKTLTGQKSVRSGLPGADGLFCRMPKYRIYLSEGRQIDIDAEKHIALPSDKNALARVDFYDNSGHVVASFGAAALQGYTKIDNLVDQKDRTP